MEEADRRVPGGTVPRGSQARRRAVPPTNAKRTSATSPANRPCEGRRGSRPTPQRPPRLRAPRETPRRRSRPRRGRRRRARTRRARNTPSRRQHRRRCQRRSPDGSRGGTTSGAPSRADRGSPGCPSPRGVPGRRAASRATATARLAPAAPVHGRGGARPRRGSSASSSRPRGRRRAKAPPSRRRAPRRRGTPALRYGRAMPDS